jgi:hypothetical protein
MATHKDDTQSVHTHEERERDKSAGAVPWLLACVCYICDGIDRLIATAKLSLSLTGWLVLGLKPKGEAHGLLRLYIYTLAIIRYCDSVHHTPPHPTASLCVCIVKKVKD